MNICDLKFCRCTMAEYKNLDEHEANMLYFVSDGDKILLFIGDDSIQSVLTENILLDAKNDDVTISNFNSGDRLENVLKNALFNIVALSKKKFEVKSDIPEIGYLNNGKYLRISDDRTLIWDDAPKGEKGDKGDTGDTGATSRLVMVYRSGKSETEQILFTPTKPIGGGYDFNTNEVILPNGWYSSDCDDKGRPLEAPIYMSSRTFSTDENLTETQWSTPIRITGNDGQAGTDGNSLEFIYYLTNDPDKNNVPIPYNDIEDEYVPKEQGWTDSPRGVDDEYQWEYFALRRKSNNSWSNWSTPALWSKYGVMGQDGDGVQYIYKRTISSSAPEDVLTPSDWDDPNSDYQTKPEYVVSGYEWYDNPKGVEETIPYEWVAVRKFCSKNNGKKMWQPYEPAKLWAKFGEKGNQGEPGAPGEPGQNGALTKFVMLYASGTDDNELSKPSGIDYDFVDHRIIMSQDSVWKTDDSDLTPPIFMSSRTFATIPELTDVEWSEPIRISGKDGEAGADGDNIEFIYFLTDSDEKKPERPSIDDDLTTLESLGWSDNPKGVEETIPYEYFSMRRTSNGNWGEWSEPALWSKYGTNGQDGDGVQYIYINTINEEDIPDNPTPEDWRYPYSEYQTLKEFKPSNWNDNPKGVSKEDGTEFEWVSMRKFQYDVESGKKMWSKFSDPKIWARLAKDGADGKDGVDGNDGVSYRTIMLYKSGFNLDSVDKLDDTMGSYDFTTHTFTISDDTWKMNDSSLLPPVYMSSRTFASNADYNDESWTDPIRITGADGVAGKDGDNIEFIFFGCDYDEIPLNNQLTSEDNVNTDGYCPTDKGWTNNPTGIAENKKYEFMSSRTKVNGNWNTWRQPVLWSKYGVNGQDGDGIEYIYSRTDSEDIIPSLTKPSDWDDMQSEFQTTSEYLPSDTDANGDLIWNDNPMGVEDVEGHRVEWVSSRKYCSLTQGAQKMWQEFSAPKVWAKFAKDGVDGQEGPQGEQGIDGKPADVKIQKYIFGSNYHPFIGVNKSQINETLLRSLPDFNELPLGKWNMLELVGMSPTEINEYMEKLDKYELIQGINKPSQPPTMFIKMGSIGTPNYTNICNSGSLATGGISFETMFPKNDFSIHIWCLEGTQTHEYDETNKEWKLSDTIKWNLPLYKTKLQQSCKGDTGETGKIGNVVYPAGEYDEAKVYHATDKKSPYVVDPLDGEYYMLKENNTYVGKKEYYDVKDGLKNNEPLYNMFCIDPDDATDDNSQQFLEVYVNVGQRVTISCDDPNYRNSFISKMNGKKYGYVKLNVRGFPNNEIKVLKKYYTLDSTGENLIVASKYIYSVDGISETWIPDRNQSPSENASSANPVWEKFESFEALYAKIGIIENGTIGSAVYSGDFMFSQQGVDKSGTVSNEYQKFNPAHIYDSDSEFKPNICMNFKTGEMHLCGGNIEFTPGEIYLSGHMRKRETVIDMNDLDKYLLVGSGSTDGNLFKHEFDFRKFGSFVILTGNKTDYKKDILYINLPSTETFYYKSLSNTAKKRHLQYLRGIVGNTYIIYNSTEYDPSEPPSLEDILQGNVGIPINYCTDSMCCSLGEGHFLKIEIALDVDAEGYEKIYPITTTGKMNFYEDNDPWNPLT